MAMDRHEIELYTKVKILLDGDQFVAPEGWEAPEGYKPGDPVLLDCTVGQVLFNQALPKDYPWFTGVADKKGLGSLINDLAERYPMDVVARALDNLKNAGFYWASRSGVTVAVSDIATPSEKPAIMERYEKQAAAIQDDFEIGTIDDEERRQELIKVWTEATDVVWCRTRRVRLCLARLSPPTVRACRFWSTSSQPTVHVRVWLIPHCVPLTRVT